MPDLYPITLDDMIGEVARELELRRYVYTERCNAGRMNRRRADRQIDVMRAVLDKLKGERDAGTTDTGGQGSASDRAGQPPGSTDP
jgi:hypothetical protein